MRLRHVAFLLVTLSAAGGASAEVVRVADLNTRQIRALDRARTMVVLQGGMLEEHGPYLPAFTDGILSERLAMEVANGVAAKKPDWTVLLFPPVSVGASGYNEIGRQFVGGDLLRLNCLEQRDRIRGPGGECRQCGSTLNWREVAVNGEQLHGRLRIIIHRQSVESGLAQRRLVQQSL